MVGIAAGPAGDLVRRQLEDLLELPSFDSESEALIGQTRRVRDRVHRVAEPCLGPVEPAPRFLASGEEAARRSGDEGRFAQEELPLVENSDEIGWTAAAFDYYAEIGPTLVPHLRDRPLTLGAGSRIAVVLPTNSVVIGDLASYSHQNGKPLPGVAQVAQQAGDGSVDPEHEFAMVWQVSPDRSKQLKLITDEAIALFDQSSFAKFMLDGRDAASVLERICANRVTNPLK